MKIELQQGDITQVKVDVIVNAANTSLLGGGGVDGSIHRAGGKAILDECRKIRSKQGGCKVGEAVITTAGNLSAKFIIHTVGPVWNDGNKNEEKLLYNAYKNSLLLAEKKQLRTIAFPNISTGIYRFPRSKAATVAIKAVRDFSAISQSVKSVLFICFDKENYTIYDTLLN